MATVFTDAGEAFVVDKLDGVITDTTKAEYIGWGTGAGTAAKADTTLFAEATEARVLGTRSQPAADTYRVVGQITADGSKTITNAGLFTAATVGTLVIHADFTGVPVLANDAIEFWFDLVFT
jgi:hypothetical protein